MCGRISVFRSVEVVITSGLGQWAYNNNGYVTQTVINNLVRLFTINQSTEISTQYGKYLLKALYVHSAPLMSATQQSVLNLLDTHRYGKQ
jgi:hypothetical protein